MSRVLNLRCTLRTSSTFAIRITRCNYSSEKGGGKQNDNTTGTTVDYEAVIPLPMSYNSYENLTSVQTTPPILIMHGSVVNQFIKMNHVN